MGTRYIRTDIDNEATGPGVTLATVSTGLIDAYLFSTGSVTASNGDGISGTVSDHDVLVHGFVVGDVNGVKVGDSGSLDQSERVVVYADGLVAGVNQAGVAVVAKASTVVNYGVIQGDTAGVVMSGISTTTTSLLKNVGSIFGDDYGVWRGASASTTEALTFRNGSTGFVTGNIFSFYGGDNIAAVDNVINRGVMEGDVSLGGGADRYRGDQGVLDGAVYGGSGNDSMIGSGSVADEFYGGADNDVFTGNGGLDYLEGGTGNDTYSVVDLNDTIVEAVGGGTDTVRSSVSFSLVNVANVENVVLVGNATTATGNGLANALTGNSLANTLTGGAGADTMSGGTGNDNYYVDNAGDVVVEAASSGTDQVFTTASHTMGANVENMTINGANSVSIGNALANNITNFGTGNHTINGGLGNDVITLNSSNGCYETLVFNTALGPNNYDTIIGYVPQSLVGIPTQDKVQLDDAIFTALTPGALPEGAFNALSTLSSGVEADDRIIFTTSDRILYYDPDGSGAQQAVAVANFFSNFGAMTAADFSVI